MTMVYVGLGSNFGDRSGYIGAAIDEIEHRLGPVAAMSRMYETAAWGNSEVDTFRYLNAVVAVRTRLSPEQVLAVILGIEKLLKRVRSTPNAPRTLDLDLLFYGSEIMDTPDLTLPHPMLHLRRFVLTPLAEIAPDLVHPRLIKTITSLLSELDDPLVVQTYEA